MNEARRRSSLKYMEYAPVTKPHTGERLQCSVLSARERERWRGRSASEYRGIDQPASRNNEPWVMVAIPVYECHATAEAHDTIGILRRRVVVEAALGELDRCREEGRGASGIGMRPSTERM